MNMKAVIYARTSSSGYQANRQDTTRQVEDLTAYCNYSKYELVKVFEEHYTASVGTNRPVLNECVEYCKINEIDILLTSELSRINRGSVFDTITFVKNLMDAHINLFAQKEQFSLLDPEGRPSVFAPILLSCLSLANSLELESIKFRLNSGRKRYVENGGKLGRNKGSVLSNKDFLDKHSDIVAFLRKGYSIRNVAKLTDKGVSTVQRVKIAIEKQMIN